MSNLINIIGGGEDKPYKINGNTLEYKNLNFFFWKQRKNIKAEDVMGFDGVIIDPKSVSTTRSFLRKLRGHSNKDLYLKPVFLLNWKNPSYEPLINELIDGVIHSLDEIEEVAMQVRQFFERYIALVNSNPTSFEDLLINKVLSFIHTRNRKSINAYPYHNSGIGYVYPILSVNYNKVEEYNVFDVLRYAEEEGYISGEFDERIYLCNSCFNGFLNYREACPRCTSTNLSSQELVHHFPCAYVGPIKDFHSHGEAILVCPKCEKTLRHIGVDYDKPSIFHECNKCYHRFQDMSVLARCISCGHENQVENLIPRDIKKYIITKKGEYGAIKGYIATKNEQRNIPGTVDNTTFKIMTEHEVERIKLSKGNSCIAMLYIKDAEKLYHLIGKENQYLLLADLVKVMRNYLRPVDTLSFENSSTILLLLTEINKTEANDAIHKIQMLVNRIISEKYPKTSTSVNVSVYELHAEADAKHQLTFLNKKIIRE